MVHLLVPGQQENNSCSWSCIGLVLLVGSEALFTVCMAHVATVVGVGVLVVVPVSHVGIVPASGLRGG